MDIGKAFSFPFDDEEWVTSILIAGLVMLIPLVGQILLIGYLFETARNVAMGSPRPLPKWSNFGEKLSTGFYGFVISLVYAIPMIVLGVLFSCVAVALSAAGGEEAAAIVAVGSFACLLPLIFLLALLTAPLVLAAWARYLQTGSLGAALDVAGVIGMVRQDMAGWLVLWLLSILCGLVGGLGTIIFIGVIFTYPYSQAVFGHLLGQKLQTMGRPSGFDYAPPAPPVSF